MQISAYYRVLSFVAMLFVIDISHASTDVAQLLNINNASAEQLAEALPGIGPAKAARIVQWRLDNGAFKDVDQLLQVKGIGEKTLEKLRNHIRIGSAAEARTSMLQEQAAEQMVRSDIRRITHSAILAATRQAETPAPARPWYKRSAMQIFRTH